MNLNEFCAEIDREEKETINLLIKQTLEESFRKIVLDSNIPDDEKVVLLKEGSTPPKEYVRVFEKILPGILVTGDASSVESLSELLGVKVEFFPRKEKEDSKGILADTEYNKLKKELVDVQAELDDAIHGWKSSSTLGKLTDPFWSLLNIPYVPGRGSLLIAIPLLHNKKLSILNQILKLNRSGEGFEYQRGMSEDLDPTYKKIEQYFKLVTKKAGKMEDSYHALDFKKLTERDVKQFFNYVKEFADIDSEYTKLVVEYMPIIIYAGTQKGKLSELPTKSQYILDRISREESKAFRLFTDVQNKFSQLESAKNAEEILNPPVPKPAEPAPIKDYFSSLFNKDASLLQPWTWPSDKGIKTLGVGIILIGVAFAAYYAWKKYRDYKCSKATGTNKIKCEIRACDEALNSARKKMKGCINSIHPTNCRTDSQVFIDKWQERKEQLTKQLKKEAA